MPQQIRYEEEQNNRYRFDVTTDVGDDVVSRIADIPEVDRPVQRDGKYGLIVTIGRCFDAEPVTKKIIERLRPSFPEGERIEIRDLDQMKRDRVYHSSSD